MTESNGLVKGLESAPDRGAALIVILWIIAFLALVAAGVSTYARTETYLARNLVSMGQARLAAEGGVHLALLMLLQAEDKWRGDGTVYGLAIGGADVDIAVFDEAGRIDLNAAQAELLDGLLKSVDLPYKERAQLVDAILDWRDEDDLRRLNGAEDADYRRAGSPYGAKDGPFESVEELRLVLGMTADIYRKVRHAVTVYSRNAGINPAVAPYEALLALPGVTPEQAQAYVAARRSADMDRAPSPPLAVVGDHYLSSAKGHIVTVYARARLPGGTQAQVSATADLDRVLRGMPFSVLSWRESIPDAVIEEFDHVYVPDPGRGS